MGILVNGQWEVNPEFPTDEKGRFVRKDSSFRHMITTDDSSDFKAEPNRYHLYISYACPWACRTAIFRKLKGLEDIISLSVVEPEMLEMGWKFGSEQNQTHDPLYHAQYLYEIYLKADSNYTGKVTVPILWDKQTHTIVNNESAEIIRMLNSAFNAFTDEQTDYYPNALQAEIDEINQFVYTKVNNGVYKTGFAKSQPAYEEAFDKLFQALDTVEERLSKQRYLVGKQITEADWRLFTTLIRFDVVYVGHFKCNLKRIIDYPNLSNYVRDLYQVPKVKETVNFNHIKTHYYKSHTNINPNQIVPKGPMIDFDASHDRNRFEI